MKRTVLLVCLLCSALLLSACAPSASGSGNGNGFGGGSGRTGLAGIFSFFSGRRSFTLTPQEKLAIGTIKLDANNQAIDRAEAAKLLPLWQLLHQLYSSSSAAPEEEAAVVDQIRSTMTPSQVASIDSMQMSRSDIFAALQQGQASASGAAGSGNENASSGARNFAGGNGSRSGGQQFFAFGGGPGGFGGGGFRNGAGAGSGSTGTTTQQNITSAQRAAAATNGITNALINQVISLLQDKLSS